MRRFGLVLACVLGVYAGCDAHEPVGDVVDPSADPINRGWIGGACETSADCEYEGAICLTDGFPGGLCSLPCEQLCPDREGPDHTQTFCVADASANGTCVSRCDFAVSPETGCRPGYGCIAASRMGEPDTQVDTCMPLGVDAEPHVLNDLQPALERAAIAADLADERVVLWDVTDPARTIVAGLRAREAAYPASVIKVAVMAAVEHQVEQGQLALDDLLTITSEQATCDSLPSDDPRPPLNAGDEETIDYLMSVMITRSDNTATNALIAAADRVEITRFMDALGLPGLQVHRYVFGCTPYTDPAWDGVHLNTMTAWETAELYRLILDGGEGFVGAASRDRMQARLGGQLWNGGFAATLPSDATFLHKTGDTSQVVHESGIILWRGHRYVVVSFNELSPSIGRPKLRELGHQVGHIMESRLAPGSP
jgi:beta-lactamase class A